MTTQTLELRRPDDWHLHVRDRETLPHVLRHTAQRFARAIIMPNLDPPVTTTGMAKRYRQRIIEALPTASNFEPLMTLFLTDNTPTSEIKTAKKSGIIFGAKLYPAGVTTNSDNGVTDVARIYGVFEAMQEHELPLQVHGEVVDPRTDIFDREKAFIDRVLMPVYERFPDLKIIFEHITTRDAVEFVTSCGNRLAATVTPHHLLYSRNAMFERGFHPHYYCLPVLKRERHRRALIDAATGGNEKFFLVTDSAPHAREHKEAACGCAGIYNAHAAIELYAEVFEQADRLSNLEMFASINGAKFYNLPVNQKTLVLNKKSWTVPDEFPFGSNDSLVPLRAGQQVHWSIESTAQ